MSFMVAKNADWQRESDVIFAVAAAANEAIKKFGKDKVINSTLGSLFEDDGTITAFPSVLEEFRTLPKEEIVPYAQISGEKDYLDKVPEALFGEYKPQAFIRAVATPGGTGAVRHCIWAYAGEGDTVIAADWHWKPYETICAEFNRKFKTFDLYTEDFQFNFNSYKASVNEALNEGDRIVTIINSPANNPTGYSLTDEEWDELLSFLKEKTEDTNKKITLLVDVAYIEFAGENNEQKKFFTKFTKLPKNLFVFVAYSMSKGYAMYGMRSGAAVGISSYEEVTEEFFYSLSHSNRANWSNGVRAAQKIMVRLMNDEKKKALYMSDIKKAQKMLKKRADAFVSAAEEAGLVMLPYRGGFFISIPTDKSKLIAKKLEEQNIFVLPLSKGIRFAICAVDEEKCKLGALKIKEAMNSL